MFYMIVFTIIFMNFFLTYSKVYKRQNIYTEEAEMHHM